MLHGPRPRAAGLVGTTCGVSGYSWQAGEPGLIQVRVETPE